jgi:hypothetical protein
MFEAPVVHSFAVLRRAGVTVALRQLETRGVINRQRGTINISDGGALRALARPLN